MHRIVVLLAIGAGFIVGGLSGVALADITDDPAHRVAGAPRRQAAASLVVLLLGGDGVVLLGQRVGAGDQAEPAQQGELVRQRLAGRGGQPRAAAGTMVHRQPHRRIPSRSARRHPGRPAFVAQLAQ